MRNENAPCFRLLVQAILRDFALAFAEAETARAANTSAMAMITSSSFSVNAARRLRWREGFIWLKEWLTYSWQHQSRAELFANRQNPASSRCRLQKPRTHDNQDISLPNGWSRWWPTPKSRWPVAGWPLGIGRLTESNSCCFHSR